MDFKPRGQWPQVAFLHLSVFDSPFPLTPALSLWERGNRCPLVGKPGALGSLTSGLRRPLSPGERVRVRGKGRTYTRDAQNLIRTLE